MLIMSIVGLIAEGNGIFPARVLACAVRAFALAISESDQQGNLKPPYRGDLIAELESDNNYIQVLQDGDDTFLALNDGHAIHSIYNPKPALTCGPWDYFALGPS